jgi:hypothetical protein
MRRTILAAVILSLVGISPRLSLAMGAGGGGAGAGASGSSGGTGGNGAPVNTKQQVVRPDLKGDPLVVHRNPRSTERPGRQ